MSTSSYCKLYVSVLHVVSVAVTLIDPQASGFDLFLRHGDRTVQLLRNHGGDEGPPTISTDSDLCVQ